MTGRSRSKKQPPIRDQIAALVDAEFSDLLAAPPPELAGLVEFPPAWLLHEVADRLKVGRSWTFRHLAPGEDRSVGLVLVNGARVVRDLLRARPPTTWAGSSGTGPPGRLGDDDA